MDSFPISILSCERLLELAILRLNNDPRNEGQAGVKNPPSEKVALVMPPKGAKTHAFLEGVRELPRRGIKS